MSGAQSISPRHAAVRNFDPLPDGLVFPPPPWSSFTPPLTGGKVLILL